MAKCLHSFTTTLFKYLPPMLNKRGYNGGKKIIWNDAPVCKAHKKSDAGKKCHPKETSCSALSAAVNVCPLTAWPKCGEPDVKLPPYLSCCCEPKLTERPCTKHSTLKRKPEKKPFKSMWEVNGIEKPYCPLPERLDNSYYVPSDKVKRIYTQTWKSCEPVIRTRRVCCLNEMCMLPPLEKRVKPESNQTAKEQDIELLKVDYNLLRKCLDNVVENPNTKPSNKCRKIVMPCCRKVSKSLKCRYYRPKSKCLRECCPYSSFSETEHPCTRQGKPVECRCVQFINQCDINQFLIRKKVLSIPPALPAWPPKERPK